MVAQHLPHKNGASEAPAFDETFQSNNLELSHIMTPYSPFLKRYASTSCMGVGQNRATWLDREKMNRMDDL